MTYPSFRLTTLACFLIKNIYSFDYVIIELFFGVGHVIALKHFEQWCGNPCDGLNVSHIKRSNLTICLKQQSAGLGKKFQRQRVKKQDVG